MKEWPFTDLEYALDDLQGALDEAHSKCMDADIPDEELGKTKPPSWSVKLKALLKLLEAIEAPTMESAGLKEELEREKTELDHLSNLSDAHSY